MILFRAFTDAAGERFQDYRKRTLLFSGKVARTDFGIERRVWAIAFGIEVDHVFKSGEAAVVHVRHSARDLSKRGRFERAVAQMPRQLT